MYFAENISFDVRYRLRQIKLQIPAYTARVLPVTCGRGSGLLRTVSVSRSCGILCLENNLIGVNTASGVRAHAAEDSRKERPLRVHDCPLPSRDRPAAPDGPQPPRGERHPGQAEPGPGARPPGGPEREPPPRRAPGLRVPLPRAGRERALRRAAPAAAPPPGQRGPAGRAGRLRPRSGHPGQDPSSVGERPPAGQEPPLPGRIQERQQRRAQAVWPGLTPNY